jgi:hypothetical protein
MVSSLPHPPTRGQRLCRRTSLLLLRCLLTFPRAIARWRRASVPVVVSARLWGVLGSLGNPLLRPWGVLVLGGHPLLVWASLAVGRILTMGSRL